MADERAKLNAMLEAAKAQQKKQDMGPNVAAFSLSRATTEDLAQKLSSRLDRPVVDMTQLKGRYDFWLTWAEDAAHLFEGAPAPQPGPSIFTALQEQLGLRLAAARQEFQLLVVDKALKIPTSN